MVKINTKIYMVQSMLATSTGRGTEQLYQQREMSKNTNVEATIELEYIGINSRPKIVNNIECEYNQW